MGSSKESKESRERRRERRKKSLLIILTCCVTLFIGYFILNYIQTDYDPNEPQGNTFYIVLGCTIMAISTVVIFLTIKKEYNKTRRKKKKVKHVFLKDHSKKSNS